MLKTLIYENSASKKELKLHSHRVYRIPDTIQSELPPRYILQTHWIKKKFFGLLAKTESNLFIRERKLEKLSSDLH